MAIDVRRDLHRLTDELADEDLHAALAFAEFLRARRRRMGDTADRPVGGWVGAPVGDAADDPMLRAFLEAPEADDTLTPEDIDAIEEAKAEVARGELVTLEDAKVRLLGRP